jgi:hypothetical protein
MQRTKFSCTQDAITSINRSLDGHMSRQEGGVLWSMQRKRKLNIIVQLQQLLQFGEC